MLESPLTVIGILLIGHCGKNSMGFGRQPRTMVLWCRVVNGSLVGVGVTLEVASGGYYVVEEALMWNFTTQFAGKNLLFCSLYVL